MLIFLIQFITEVFLHTSKIWPSPVVMCFVADGVDGKQARRTNSSTPLGELFDHGLDSWSCVYFVVTVYSIFGRGPSGVSVFVLYLLLWVVLFSFILSHWEKYNTGVLFLPWGYDISQVVSMGFHLNFQYCINWGGKFLSFLFIALMLFKKN